MTDAAARMTVLAHTCGRCVVAVLLLIALCLGRGAGEVRAQGAVLHFEPSSSEIGVGQETEIQIYLENVDDLAGIDLRFEFTPGLIEVLDADAGADGVQIEPGPFPYPDYPALNDVDNIEGGGKYIATQLSPRAPARGSGVVATIRLRGLLWGRCLLTVTYVKATDDNAGETSLTALPGELVVRPSSQSLATLPPTRTYTPAPFPTNTPMPLASATSGALAGYSAPELPTASPPDAYAPPPEAQPSLPTRVEATQAPLMPAAQPTVPPAGVSPSPEAGAVEPAAPLTPWLTASTPGAPAPGLPPPPPAQAPADAQPALGPQGREFAVPTLEPLATPRPRAERPRPLIAPELFMCLVVFLIAFTLLLALYLLRRPGRPASRT